MPSAQPPPSGHRDRYGHGVGDRVLQEVAERIKVAIRSVDMLARYGGEEFLLLTPGTEVADAARVAERIRVAVAETDFDAQIAPVNLTISIGVAAYVPGDSPMDVIERADMALYRAKETGRDRIEVAG